MPFGEPAAGRTFSLGNFQRVGSSHTLMKQLVALAAFTLTLPVAALFAQDNQTVASQPALELPAFVVTDSRELPPPESWRYGTIEGFEILTNASDKATQRLLRDFDMFRQALSYVWPVPNRVVQNSSLIICGRGAKFDAFATGRNAGIDLKGVSFTGMGAGIDSSKASLFLRQGNHAAIIIDLQATTLNVLNSDDSLDAATGTDSGVISVEHDKQLYREYVRYLMSQHEPRSPAWLEEGISQVLMKMQFDRRWIEFAKLEDPNTVSTQAAMVAELNAASAAAGEDGAIALPGAPAEDRDFAAALRRKALVPLDKFFAVTHNSPEASNPLGNNRWAKQAYAFVHMCLYGHKGKYQKAFTTFIQRAAREPVTEQMFKECFRFPKGKGKDGQEIYREMSFNDMLSEIRSYCDFTVYESKIFQSKKGGPDLIIPAPAPVLREATHAEVGRIKGEALVLAGHIKPARAELIAPYTRGERDPNLLAAIALYEKAHGDPERARKFLEAAYAGKTTRVDANLEIARLRYAEALEKPGAPESRFSAAQVAAVMAPLQVARKQRPPSPAVYDLAAETLVRSDVAPKRDDAVFLIEGAQLFPTQFKVVHQGAVVAARAGELQAAHALADHGIKYVTNPAGKKRFEELKAALPPAPAAAAEPATPAPASPAEKKK